MSAKISNHPSLLQRSSHPESSSNQIKRPNKMDGPIQPRLWTKRAATTWVKYPGQHSLVLLRTGLHLPRQILSAICQWLLSLSMKPQLLPKWS